QVVVFDAQQQLAFAQARGEALADVAVGGALHGLAALVEEDAVATTKGGQRADDLQLLGETGQLLALLAQLPLDGTRQAHCQAVEALAQQLQVAPRVLRGQARVQAAQALLVLGQALGMGAAQAHVEIVESLGLLAQAFTGVAQPPADAVQAQPLAGQAALHRSEEHTSELQSRENLVCRLLLEKKNKL